MHSSEQPAEYAAPSAKDIATGAIQMLRLTPIECTLLFTLMRQGGKVLSHQSLLHAVWGTGYHEEVDYIRVYLHTLRLKLEDDPRHPTYLETIVGVGYRFRQPCAILQ